MPNIVNVVVTQQVASAPITIQRTGAIVSQGATTLSAGSTALITQMSDLTAILTGAVSITSMTWATGVVTVTTTTPHGIPSGDTVLATIAGVTPTGYNGTYEVTSTGTNTFTYALASNPGAVTVFGTVTLEDVSEVVAAVTTYFAQGYANSVYILELGVGTPAQGVTALEVYIANPSKRFYSYLLPKTWDTEPTAVTMAKQYTGTTAQTYFFVTTTLSTYTNWSGIKSVFALAQSPSAPATELTIASAFYITLNYNPSGANLVTPLDYSYVYAVTAYSTLTNAQQSQLSAAGVNFVSTFTVSNIQLIQTATATQTISSNTILYGGNMMDLNTFNYWYTIDWLSINEDVALTTAVVNGSNTPQNPLYYNQAGINTLQKVAQAVVNNGIAFGMILSPATVNAVPFTTYIAENPSDYAAGIYRGLSVTFTPQRGFSSITIYLTASNIPV